MLVLHPIKNLNRWSMIEFSLKKYVIISNSNELKHLSWKSSFYCFWSIWIGYLLVRLYYEFRNTHENVDYNTNYKTVLCLILFLLKLNEFIEEDISPFVDRTSDYALSKALKFYFIKYHCYYVCQN